jgi:hypothetical protein
LFVANEDSKLLEVARFPVAEVTLLYCRASGNPPAKFSLVHKPNVDVEEALLKIVLDRVHDLPPQPPILATENQALGV